jgi:sugar phosphate isomerase/epimerase
MSSTTRRLFLAHSAAFTPIARALFAGEPLRASNLGVQLYTVRNIIDKDPLTVLRAVQEIGYKEAEVTYGNLKGIWPALKQTSLQPVSAHIDEQIFVDGGSTLDAALADVKEKGFKYAVVPYIAPAHRGGADTFKRLADTLNKSGQKAQADGLKLCYHNHAFEFQPFGSQTGFEMLMSETDKNLVSLEMDMFWVSVAGHDPIELLHRYKGRVALLHLKDKSSSFTETQYNEKVPKETFKEVGSGSIDVAAVLKAADAAGVQHYFVEQDQTPGDPIESLRKSFTYLSSRFGS